MFGGLAVGRDAHHRPARGRGRDAHRARPCAPWAPRSTRRGDEWLVEGTGNGALLQPAAPLDFGNAGTGSRLTMGLVGSYDMDDHLHRRRLAVAAADGPRARSAARHGRAGRQRGSRRPHADHLARRPRTPAPITYRVPVASAQVKSAVLLAGLNTPGVTTVIEPVMTRDHTEKMLAASAPSLKSRPTATAPATIRIDRPGPPDRPDHRRPRRPVLGGLSDRGGADRAGLRRRHRERAAQPDAHRPASLTLAGDGRRDRRSERRARRRRGCRRPARARLRAAAASRFRPSARRR